MFKDAATFGASILDKNASISQEMEEYAFQVLTHFCPFRTLEDLKINHSYVEKFRQWYFDLRQEPEQFLYVSRILTNIQILRNSCHVRRDGDSLSNCTDMFVDPDILDGKKEREPDYNKEKAYYAKEYLKLIQSMIENETDTSRTEPFTNNSHLSLLQLQKKGTWNCGFKIFHPCTNIQHFFLYTQTKIHAPK
jgi:hypothetical protein